jgi:hypothetical protein
MGCNALEAPGVADMVTFQSRYLDVDALSSLAAPADVVILPYDSHEQVTSGVLIEAVTAHRPVIATAFARGRAAGLGSRHRRRPRRSRRHGRRHPARPVSPQAASMVTRAAAPPLTCGRRSPPATAHLADDLRTADAAAALTGAHPR